MLPASEFHANKRNKKDGLAGMCKVCKQQYRNPIIYSKDDLRTKTCHKKDKCINPSAPNLLLNEFFKTVANKDGLAGTCKVCKKQDNLANVAKLIGHRIKSSADKKITKVCIKGLKCKSKIGAEQPLSSFLKANANTDGLNNECKTCKKIYLQEYNDKPESKVRAVKQRKQWAADNPEKTNANSAKNRAKRIERIVRWSSSARIAKMYWLAKELTKRTNILWVVDHIIPLQGKLVSGLHIENNLQVITAIRNGIKSNKFTPFQGDTPISDLA